VRSCSANVHIWKHCIYTDSQHLNHATLLKLGFCKPQFSPLTFVTAIRRSREDKVSNHFQSLCCDLPRNDWIWTPSRRLVAAYFNALCLKSGGELQLRMNRRGLPHVRRTSKSLGDKAELRQILACCSLVPSIEVARTKRSRRRS
jgi:hypothetical protein